MNRYGCCHTTTTTTIIINNNNNNNNNNKSNSNMPPSFCSSSANVTLASAGDSSELTATLTLDRSSAETLGPAKKPPARRPQKPRARCEEEPRPPVVPLWRSTVRAAPDFAGTVPYDPPDMLDRLEVPLQAGSSQGDDGACFYVGMYTDLRERLALMRATVEFEGHAMADRHRKMRALMGELGEQERHVMAQVNKLEEQAKEQIEWVQLMNVGARRIGKTS